MIEKARGIVIKDGKVLLMLRYKRNQIYCTIPGGGREPEDNTIQDTAIRELQEETSLDVQIVEEIASVTNKENDTTQHMFLCKYTGGELELGDSVEMAKMNRDPDNFYKPVWVSAESALEQDIRPTELTDAFKKYIRQNLR